jgi:hypothetical protein
MSVWKTLSSIDVNQHTERKGQFTYLSWTWGWATLMEHYPESTYEFLPNEIHNDESVTVHCKMTVEGISHTMWLAVMDNKNRAIKNPSATDIANNKMRCLVKALAMFGLGHYIYAGESVPKINPYEELHLVVNQGDPMDLLYHLNTLDEDEITEAYNGAPKGQKQAFKDQVRTMERAAHAEIDDIAQQLRDCMSNDDKTGLDEIWEDCTHLVRKLIGARLSPAEQHAFKAIRAVGDTQAPEQIESYSQRNGG